MDNRLSSWSSLCCRSLELQIISRVVYFTDTRVVFKITSGSKQTRLDKICFFSCSSSPRFVWKSDIGRKLSSKRFHGQNNSEFSNWFRYTSRMWRKWFYISNQLYSVVYHFTAHDQEHFLHQQFFFSCSVPKVCFVNINRRSFCFLCVYTQLWIKVNRNSGCLFQGWSVKSVDFHYMF